MTYSQLLKGQMEVPDWLLDELLSQPNLGVIYSSKINRWAIDNVLPVVATLTGQSNLWMTANHIHVGDQGIIAHDHIPHVFSSVVFLTDSLGELVINLPTGFVEVVIPVKGNVVVFPSQWVHHVKPSPRPELRVTFVSNYEFKKI